MASQRDLSLFSHSPTLFSFLLFLIFFIHVSPKLCFAANYISFNQSLSGNQTITSPGGNFELGFFQLGKENSNRYYIGIWFRKVSKLTPIWVANRNSPVSNPSTSQLKISDDGNLVLLLSHSNTPVWSTNITSMAANSTAIAEIQDTGSLVLRDFSDLSMIFWQSFDHPTDTWLPGLKFSLDKMTRKGHVLTSWKNSDDPTAGIFSLELDPTGVQQIIVLWNRTKQYWSTGPWNGHFFNSVPEMTPYRQSPIVVNVSVNFFSNSTTNYFMYDLKGDMINRTTIDIWGQLKQSVWLQGAQAWINFLSLPNKGCDVYALCGPFGSCNDSSLGSPCSCIRGFSASSPSDWKLGDWSRGCARDTQLQCGGNSSADGAKDGFFPMSNTRLPDDPQSLAASSVEECELLCLDNCSCTAYSYNGKCSVWVGELLNVEQLSDGSIGETLHVRLAASELSSTRSKRTAWKFVVIGAASAFALLAFALVLFLMHHRRRRKLDTDAATEGNLVVFRYSDLQRMTGNFSERLGGGGFGSVFKGTLPDSTSIAVKQLRGLHHQGEKQFRNEVSTIGIIQHVNLVRLRGFCSEGNQRLLVYDYMTKGSLNTHLFRKCSSAMDWKARYNIAIGTARGLAYLHEQCRDCIIHCDVKPENILLDESFHPKLADFGLAKLVGRDFSKVLTTMRGTLGYLAPEWISGEAITPKADTYSYGMTLLELVSGRRNREQSGEDCPYFPVFAASRLMEGDILSLLDPRLNGNAELDELERACKVACWCIQDDETHRPSMAQVVQILEGALEVNPPPIPRSLQALTGNQDNKYSSESTSSGQSSMKTLTIWTTSPAESTAKLASNFGV